ncbi:hypothetical protein [Vibrio sp. M260118]|uniref:hypothetical protein n=1 Tax=Vibrio sp. M260118 TaxID=3020896 RepID=UPI002F412403
MGVFHLTIEQLEDREAVEQLINQSGVDAYEISKTSCLLADNDVTSAQEMATKVGLIKDNDATISFFLSAADKFYGYQSNELWEWIQKYQGGK